VVTAGFCEFSKMLFQQNSGFLAVNSSATHALLLVADQGRDKTQREPKGNTTMKVKTNVKAGRGGKPWAG